MQASSHLPDAAVLQCDRVFIAQQGITLLVSTTAVAAICPACGSVSWRIHSRYTRTVADLPWHNTPVWLQLQVRRFFCDVPTCPRRIFVERVPTVAARHARKTCRMLESLSKIGLALGGQAGCRLASQLGLCSSPDSLLRIIRHGPLSVVTTPRVLGVDDWAWRRGTRYGTILCDLERHRPIDLLGERTADSLASWLQEHPGVQVISRDRASCYAEGAHAGAPQAVQVADRWHLLRNVREALMRLLNRHHRDLREAARVVRALSEPTPAVVQPLPQEPTIPPTPAQQPSCASRDRRLERYQRLVELNKQGLSGRAIATAMGLHRETVQRYLHAGTFPERADRQYARKTDSVRDFLQRRWQEGCHNAGQLTRELLAEGMAISYYSVKRSVAHWRLPGDPPTAAASTSVYQPSSRRVSWLLLQEDRDLEAEDRPLVEALLARSTEVRAAADLARDFRQIIRHRQSNRLEDWAGRAQQAAAPRELMTFAKGLKADWAAVQAALSMEWSNGQVEGQVNRLKMIKRQMYGRAGFDLLRQRVLHGS